MLDLRFVASDLRRLDEISAEVVACGVFRDERPFRGMAGLLDWRLAGRLSRLARQGFLVGEVGELLAVPVRSRLSFDKLLIFGLGPRDAFGDRSYQQVLDRAVDALRGLHVKRAVLELPGRGTEAISAEHAAEVLFEVLSAEERDIITLVEDPSGREGIEKHADRRRAASRTSPR